MTEWGRVWGDGEGPVADPGLLSSLNLVREAHSRPGYAYSDGEVLENLRAAAALAAAVDAVKLGLLAELDSRPDAVPGAPAGQGAVTFLTEALRFSRGQARRDAAAAASVASGSPVLPLMGQALVDGDVTREHLDVAVGVLRRVPKALKTKPVTDQGGVSRTGAAVIDALLTGQARVLPPDPVERLGRQIVHRLDPARAERFDADAHERRTCSISSDFAGMGVYRFFLDQATHLQVKAVIAAFSAPRPAGTAVDEDGAVVQVKDTRTLGQRQADAITDLILTAAGQTTVPTSPTSDPAADPDPDPEDTDDQSEDTDDQSEDTDDQSEDTDGEVVAGGFGEVPGRAQDGSTGAGAGTGVEAGVGRGLPAGVFLARPCPGIQLSLIATLDQIAAAHGATDPAAATAGLARMSLAGRTGTYPGATIHPQVLARLSCDSPIRRIVVDDRGVVLSHGRAKRFATGAQKRALAVRDGGCVIPGCHAPPEWCDTHHVIPWEHGGVTDINAMVLLCGRHHTAHHAGIYDIQIRDGMPWVRVPAWIDPARPWLRTHTHTHHTLADSTAATLTGNQPALPPWQPDTDDPWTAPGDAA